MSLNLFDHPKGLLVCFGTELWERFSYYGMRALLIFYLTQHFLFSDDKSYAIYGAYTALAWGLPVIGGILADRYIGPRKAVTIGALLLSAGHLLMAIEGPPAVSIPGAEGVHVVEQHDGYLNLFFLSLALIVSGVGFLKTNITTIVGALYGRDDPRREPGFTIFYLGINIGSAAAPLLCGWLGQVYGWRYGFGLAGIGMLAGLAVFLRGQHLLAGHADPPDADRLRMRVFAGLNREHLNYFAAAAMVLASWLLIQHHQAVGAALGGFGVVVGSSILYFSVMRCSPVERDRMLVVATLIVFAILFWSLYEQKGSSLNLFSDRLVDRRIFGMEVQASQLQALPAFFVILLAPLFTVAWTSLALRKRNPTVPAKFAGSLVFVGFAFLMPVFGAAVAGEGNRIGLIWYVGLSFFMVCGELMIAPIAMNMVTRLCPKRVVGMMMGAYFLAMSIGSFIAGQLAKLTSVDRQLIEAGTAMPAYSANFRIFAALGIGTGILLYFLAPVVHRRMHESAKESAS